MYLVITKKKMNRRNSTWKLQKNVLGVLYKNVLDVLYGNFVSGSSNLNEKL